MNTFLMRFLEYLLYSNVHFSVTSARRTPEQNKACNGAPNSQHLVGEAVDIKPFDSTTFNKLLEEIHFFSDNVSPFDQLIIYPTFIHISFGDRNRRQVIDKR
jgi:hypothetical protein